MHRGVTKVGILGAQGALAVQEFANVVVPQAALDTVTPMQRARAICAMAQIGNAHKCKHSAAAVKAAANALRSGDAFRQSVYADDVSAYLDLSTNME
jgi:hypothetical protein